MAAARMSPPRPSGLGTLAGIHAPRRGESLSRHLRRIRWTMCSVIRHCWSESRSRHTTSLSAKPVSQSAFVQCREQTIKNFRGRLLEFVQQHDRHWACAQFPNPGCDFAVGTGSSADRLHPSCHIRSCPTAPAASRSIPIGQTDNPPGSERVVSCQRRSVRKTTSSLLDVADHTDRPSIASTTLVTASTAAP